MSLACTTPSVTLLMRRTWQSLVLLALGVAPLGLTQNASSQQHGAAHSSKQIPGAASIHFVDIAAQAGLTMMNVNGGDTQKQFLIETTGSGAVIFDYDNDGWPDIFLPNGSTVEGFPPGKEPTGHLYHNNHDGTFTDVTEKAGLARAGWGQGACVGDYDNDGNLDLFVTFWGQNVLYHNNGDGTFTDVTEEAGLKTARGQWSTGCSFVDYDRDGRADLFVVRYVDFSYDSVPKPGEGEYCVLKGVPIVCGPRGLKKAENALFHNNANGTFSDVSEKAGITKTAGCYGLTSLAGDFDQDGWPDIYVACDSTPNILYHNNRDGTFTDIGHAAGVAFNEDGALQAGMGLAADDFTHVGRQSIIKTNFSDDTPTLYLNRGENVFDDVTLSSGVGGIRNCLGWGVQFFDFDNSGWPGIFIVNGHIAPEVDGKGLGTSYREPKVLYRNLRNGKFANVTARSGSVLNEKHSARGLALGDLFNDGRLEALVNNMNEKPSLYRNTASIGNFISLQLIGTKSNRAALGAEVTAQTDKGPRTQEVRSGGSYIAQNDLRLHFGLGQADKTEKVTIRWPSGLSETLFGLAANKFYIVREGQGVDKARTRGASNTTFSNQDSKPKL
jgi:enediyne biosynthesis protein E4